MSETQDFTKCPHWGHGGRYVIDPVSGERVPATDDVPAVEVSIPADPAPAIDGGAPAGTEKPVKKAK